MSRTDNGSRARLILLLAIISWGSLKGQELTPDVLASGRAILVNSALFKQLPRYTCTEDISRGHFAAKHRKVKREDTVQVEVAAGDNQELYSWPGSAAFTSEDLPSLVGHGFLSSGVFQSFAENLFLLGHGIVKADGNEMIEGRQALRFTYSIPSLESNWDMNWLGIHGVLGEAGKFWIDAQSYVLLRLDVFANRIPANLPLTSVNIRIKYQIATHRNIQALIPQSAFLTAVDRTGETHFDDLEFSHCHVFESESRVGASPGAFKEVLDRYERQRGVLPPGLTMQLTLETPVQVKSARVGDRIAALLDHPLRIAADQTIPQGAEVKGRIREFTPVDDLPDTYVVGFEFDQIISAGHSYDFLARMKGTQPIEGLSSELFSGQEYTSSVPAGTVYRSTTGKVTAVAIPGAATFFLHGAASLPKGFRMTWRSIRASSPPNG